MTSSPDVPPTPDDPPSHDPACHDPACHDPARREPRAPDRFTVRCAEDLVALVPVVIGFEPEESLTLLSFAARPPGRVFHARVDLPPLRGAQGDGPVDGPRDGRPDGAALAEVARSLAEPARRHRISQVALVAHSARPRLAAATVARVAATLAGTPAAREESGVELVDCLRVHGSRWFRVPTPHARGGPTPPEGVPCDVALHPFRLRSVVAGRVLHGSRAALAETVQPDAAAVADLSARTRGLPPTRGAAEEEWARRTVLGAVAGRPPGAPEAARLLVGMQDLRVRDAAWATMTRANAPRHVEVWRDLVRRAPDPLLPAPGSLLAFAAWLAGEGALAWCALDRVGAVDPEYRLAGLVATTLEQAYDPRLWTHDGGRFDDRGAEPARRAAGGSS